MFNFSTTTPRLIRVASGLLTGAVMLAVAACSSDSDSGSDDTTFASALQGDWQAACDVLQDDLSSRSTVTFDGSEVQRSEIFYVGNNNCNSGTIFNLLANATFTLPGSTSTTDAGDAQHITIETTTIEATSTQTLDALLALQGITFEQLLQDELGIADASNITPESAGLVTPLFSLALIEGDTLYFGDSESNQGTDEETRLTTLDQDPASIFERL